MVFVVYILSFLLVVSSYGTALLSEENSSSEIHNGAQKNELRVNGNSLYTTGNSVVYVAPTTPPAPTATLMRGMAPGNSEECAPSHTRVNNIEGAQPNPLYNTSLKALTMHQDRPLCVTDKDPSTLVYVDMLTTNSLGHCMTIPNIHDPNGEPGAIAGIISSGSYIVAAVAQKSQDFGIESGFALVRQDGKEVDEKKEDGTTKKNYIREFVIINPQTGQQENKSIPFDIHHPAISINNGIAKLGNTMAMHYDAVSQRVYVGFDILTCADATDSQGGAALCMLSIESGTLSIDPICNDNQITCDSCLGVCGAGKRAAVHHIKTMTADTLLPYLIIVGGTGSFDETSRNVYAMPLAKNNPVQKKEPDVLSPIKAGMISPGSQMIETVRKAKVISRSFKNNMRDQAQVLQVGGEKAPGIISDMAIMGDTVYVSVVDADGTICPGIFFSQAIFDQSGRIRAWSSWRRFGGISHGVLKIHAFYEFGTAQIVNAIRDNDALLVKPSFTSWAAVSAGGDSMCPLASYMYREFGTPECKLHGLLDVPYARNTSERIFQENAAAWIVATGNRKVVIAERGSCNEQGIFIPYTGAYTGNVISLSDGTLATTHQDTIDHPRALTISGGVLNDLGALNSAAVVSNGKTCWLFVGGTGGLAVLSDKQGCGWSVQEGIQPSFASLSSDMAFKKIPSPRFIRKLIRFENSLYILTNKQILKLSLDGIEDLSVAQMQDIGDTENLGELFDMGISHDFMMVASSKGLWYAQNPAHGMWHEVPLAADVQPVHTLFFVSPSQSHEDFAHGGQVYALRGSRIHNKTEIFRLYVDSSCGIEQSVQIVPGLDKQCPQVFAYAIGFKDLFYTNGSIYLWGASQTMKKGGSLQFSRPTDLAALRLKKLEKHLPIPMGTSIQHVGPVVYDSSVGSLLIGYNLGLCVH